MTSRADQVRNRRWLAWVLIPLGLLLVIGANAHLVYVAIESQPDCVEHESAGFEGKSYSAAKPAC